MNIDNENIESIYIDFFNKVNMFLSEQEKQKQRGLNDYNMVNVVRKENAEVGMHSNVIYSLIDPNGLHYQEELFLKIFIKEVLGIEENFGKIVSVNSEEITSKNRRIDFTIKSSNYYIGIEMKIDATDLNEQISHYYYDLKEKASHDNEQEVIIYYLTKDGKYASKYSSKNIDYKRISFEKHILNWINLCQVEIRNITNLNEAFENYKQIVKKITNQYKGNVMPLSELLKEKENFILATNIYKNYNKAAAEIENEFWNKVINKLKESSINGFMKDTNAINIQNIEKARVSIGSTSSEVYMEFLLYKIDLDTEVILQIGSSNSYEGIYGKIAKIKKAKWVTGNNAYEETILNVLDKISYLKFSRKSWAYGFTILNDSIQLRNEKLIDADEKVDELVNLIEKLIKDFTLLIKEI